MKSVLLATTACIALVGAAHADPLKITPVAIGPTEDVLSPGLAEKAVAEGAFRLENR